MRRFATVVCAVSVWTFLVAGQMSAQIPLSEYDDSVQDGINRGYVRKQREINALASQDAAKIAKLLEAGDAESRSTALAALAEKEPGEAAGALPVLTKILKSDSEKEPFFCKVPQRGKKRSPVVSAEAFNALGKCGPEAAPLVVELFRSAADARAIESVKAACEALGAIGVNSPEVVAVLRSPRPAWAAQANAAMKKIQEQAK